MKFKLPHGEAHRNSLLINYKKSAKRRRIVWQLTKEEFFSLTVKKCFYCGAFPRLKRTAKAQKYNGQCLFNGLDRKDNWDGYTTENTVPCCSPCNRAKGSMSFEDFMGYILQLTAYQIDKK